MVRPRTTRTIGILFAAALVAAGCGGGDDGSVPADGAVTPTPGVDATQAPVGDAGIGATPQLDANGQPIPSDPSAGGSLGATAEIPDLSGGDIGGGLGAVNSTPIFSASAVAADSIDQTLGQDTTKFETPATDTTVSEEAAPDAPTYSGARFSVDGIVVTVDKNGAFPKDNPVFRLLSINASNVEVELIAGEFTTGGGSGVVLDKGELVSLVNASEQLTYRVKYLRPVTSTAGISLQ
jgi:hypothetical protein